MSLPRPILWAALAVLLVPAAASPAPAAFLPARPAPTCGGLDVTLQGSSAGETLRGNRR